MMDIPLYAAHPEPTVAVKDVIDLIRDYGNDALFDSEYRLACDDLIEALTEKQHSALSAQVKDVAIPEGWQLVPKKATREMCKEGECWTPMPEQVWEDMLGAAPISDLESAPAAKLEAE